MRESELFSLIFILKSEVEGMVFSRGEDWLCFPGAMCLGSCILVLLVPVLERVKHIGWEWAWALDRKVILSLSYLVFYSCYERTCFENKRRKVTLGEKMYFMSFLWQLLKYFHWVKFLRTKKISEGLLEVHFMFLILQDKEI